MNHFCAERERLDELRGPIGQAAYSYYSEWMRLMKRSVPSIETFSTSKMYSSFVKFVHWAQKVKLPNPVGYIRMMVDTGTRPPLWCRDNAYALYLSNYDAAVPPTTQFLQTIDVVTALAKEHNCTPQEVFAAIGVNEVLNLVQQRKLSPWFCVSSHAFRDFMMTRSADDALALEDAIQVGAMIMRIQQNPASVTLFKEDFHWTSGLGILLIIVGVTLIASRAT